MTGLNISQLKNLVIKPALEFIGLYSDAACNLVTGTALVESQGVYLHQTGTGPALGLFQMEPATLHDCFNNYLKFNTVLKSKVDSLTFPGMSLENNLIGNLFFAAALCRIKFARSLHPLPAATDANELAEFWKKIYNSDLGAGSVDASHIAAFESAIKA